MKPIILAIIIAFAILAGLLFLNINLVKDRQKDQAVSVNNFEQCVAQGNPIIKSYPERCRSIDGRLFIRDIGNELEKRDLISSQSPRPGELVKSPLSITGEARGNWYFEASFPVQLLDSNGAVLAQGVAQAKGDWMTENFVPFAATLEFSVPTTSEGTLILKKDNPSGLPENDDELRIPVKF